MSAPRASTPAVRRTRPMNARRTTRSPPDWRLPVGPMRGVAPASLRKPASLPLLARRRCRLGQRTRRSGVKRYPEIPVRRPRTGNSLLAVSWSRQRCQAAPTNPGLYLLSDTQQVVTIETICSSFQRPSLRSRISHEAVAPVTPQSSGCSFIPLYANRVKRKARRQNRAHKGRSRAKQERLDVMNNPYRPTPWTIQLPCNHRKLTRSKTFRFPSAAYLASGAATQ
jgi:hypothetical protein